MSEYLAILNSFNIWDFIAVSWLIGSWWLIGRWIEHPPKTKPSVSVMMREYRREWMRQFVHREPRLFDSNILANLRESTAFFASASMIAIGGGLALIGNSDRLAGFARQFELGDIPIFKWEIKIIVPLLFVVDAFLKFVWSNRLFGYCAIVMGSVPNNPHDPAADIRARQAADLNIRAAKSFNAGLRDMHFGLGALGWLAGPIALLVTATLVLAITWRREFASGSRHALLTNPIATSGMRPGNQQHDQTDKRQN